MIVFIQEKRNSMFVMRCAYVNVHNLADILRGLSSERRYLKNIPNLKKYQKKILSKY